jgi:hypothetical protein
MTPDGGALLAVLCPLGQGAHRRIAYIPPMGIGGFEPVGEGTTLRALPTMSEHFLALAYDNAYTARENPTERRFPAGAVISAAATLEAYVNELAEVAFSVEPDGAAYTTDFNKLNDNLPAKLAWFSSNSKSGTNISEQTIDDVRILLYGLRGLLMHYRATPEHPDETKTTLQRLAKRFPQALVGQAELAIEKLLTPEVAAWAVDLTEQVIKEMYATGWDVPTPQWLQLVDPTKFASPQPTP